MCGIKHVSRANIVAIIGPNLQARGPTCYHGWGDGPLRFSSFSNINSQFNLAIQPSLRTVRAPTRLVYEQGGSINFTVTVTIDYGTNELASPGLWLARTPPRSCQQERRELRKEDGDIESAHFILNHTFLVTRIKGRLDGRKKETCLVRSPSVYQNLTRSF